MGFEQIQVFTQVGSVINEDRGYGCNQYGWVIDGATGLAGVHITDGPSDAAWLAEQIHNRLKHTIQDTSKSLETILNEASEAINDVYEEIKGQQCIVKEGMPSAGITVVRVVGEMLQYYSLGDCTLLVGKKDGSVTHIYEGSIHPYDEKGIEALVRQAKEKGKDVLDARVDIQEILVANRQMKNTMGGYWCFSIEGNDFSQGIQGEIPMKEVDAVLIMSDGFMQYLDTLHQVDTDEALLHAVAAEGVEAIGQKIRQIQEQDAKANMYPRFKRSDDTTAVYMCIAH